MKPALSTNGGKILNEALFSAMAEAGIQAIEISRTPQEMETFDYDEVKRLARRYGIALWSFHLPFIPFRTVDISREEIAESTVSYLKSIIDKATAIGIHTFVIHPSGEPIQEEERPARMACAQKSLSQLAEYAKAREAVIAVENLPRTCLGRDSSEILMLVSAHPALRVCFDTNHLLKEEIGQFIHAVGDKIITLHVSDYDFVNERHWLPGEGRVDWPRLIADLGAVGYDGYWLYEIGFAPSKTIERPRALTCRDFARNYQELMSGAAPSVLGRPITE